MMGSTGIDDPYETTQHPEIQLDTVSFSPEENTSLILNFLQDNVFVRFGDGNKEQAYRSSAKDRNPHLSIYK